MSINARYVINEMGKISCRNTGVGPAVYMVADRVTRLRHRHRHAHNFYYNVCLNPSVAMPTLAAASELMQFSTNIESVTALERSYSY